MLIHWFKRPLGPNLKPVLRFLAETAQADACASFGHNNPVVAGFIDKPEDWRCSSARNYLGLKAVLPITLFSG